MNSIKEKLRIERKKIKEMSFKEKLDYIKTYYSFHIIGFIASVAIIVWILNHFILNPPPNTFINVSFYGPLVSHELQDALSDDLNLHIVDPDLENYVAVVDNFFFSGDPQMDMMITQRFMAMVSISDLDILIVSPDQKESLINFGLAMDLREILTTYQFNWLYEIGAVYYGQVAITDELNQIIEYHDPVPFGITIHKIEYFNDLLRDFDADFEQWVMIFMINNIRESPIQAFLQHVLKN